MDLALVVKIVTYAIQIFQVLHAAGLLDFSKVTPAHIDKVVALATEIHVPTPVALPA
jgi:hypothetical protein